MKKIFLYLYMVQIFLVAGIGAFAKNVEIHVKAKNCNAEKLELVIVEKGTDPKRIPVTLSAGEGMAKIEVSTIQRILLVNYDTELQIRMTAGYIPPKASDFFVTPEDDRLDITFDGAQWPLINITGGCLTTEYELLRNAIHSSFHKEHGILKELVTIGDNNPSRKKELNAQRASLETAMNEAIVRFIERYPNSFISLYYLHANRKSMDLKQLEALYDIVKKHAPHEIMINEIAETINAKKTIIEGAQAPDFFRKDMNGQLVKLSALKGKYILLDFWGTWCMPCRKSHPHLVELHKKYSDKVEFINIANEGSRKESAIENWKAAVEKDKLTWTQILNDTDPENDIVKLFNVTAFPTKILIDDKGNILIIEIGSSSKIDAKLAELWD